MVRRLSPLYRQPQTWNTVIRTYEITPAIEPEVIQDARNHENSLVQKTLNPFINFIAHFRTKICESHSRNHRYSRLVLVRPIFHENKNSTDADMKGKVAMVTILSAIVLATMTDRVTSMPPAQCNPGLLDEVPPRIRKVCMALSTLYELGSAMENYIDDKVPVLQQNLPLPDSGVKRQDVDHVFLRFGRRR